MEKYATFKNQGLILLLFYILAFFSFGIAWLFDDDILESGAIFALVLASIIAALVVLKLIYTHWLYAREERL